MTWDDICTKYPDWDKLLVFCDWLTDNVAGGAEDAEALRFLVEKRRWPRECLYSQSKGEDTRSWDWQRYAHGWGSVSPCDLPDDFMPGDDVSFDMSFTRECLSCEEALRYFIDRYHARKTVEVSS